ncbi:DUF3408 domain-containing protein [Chryseobacterium formosus]|uniref:DUF3408 domain-containing protein n=1 Tax=Chryseobacterium formosus TaxID=1537363 RepID=A0ABT3XR37_9FLAO|nr:DUF3408 domain-containing protein [Chryseobacterium formosus]MCX8524588.1 DUF3408 domain-containing protein [Chryseobacterium formosus]
MEKNNRKTTPDIDEEFMMNLMVDGLKKEGLSLSSSQQDQNEGIINKEASKEKPVVKDKARIKKISELDYEDIFLKKSDTNARDGKTVYIRPDFHERLSRIVQVIGEDKISIYAYVDNLLQYHFQEFGEQIIKSYNNKYKPIF